MLNATICTINIMSYYNQFTANTQLKLSPFFERTSQLNESQEWRRWSGYLSATNYELTHENEYFAIRTKAALLDITPLKKYLIEGSDALALLDRLVTRNIKICKISMVFLCKNRYKPSNTAHVTLVCQVMSHWYMPF